MFSFKKIAQTSQLDEFKKVYQQEPSKLELKDKIKSWLPIHYAASKSRIQIIEFILKVSQTGNNTPKHIRSSMKVCMFEFEKIC